MSVRRYWILSDDVVRYYSKLQSKGKTGLKNNLQIFKKLRKFYLTNYRNIKVGMYNFIKATFRA